MPNPLSLGVASSFTLLVWFRPGLVFSDAQLFGCGGYAIELVRGPNNTQSAGGSDKLYLQGRIGSSANLVRSSMFNNDREATKIDGKLLAQLAAMSYDGSGNANGISLFLNGVELTAHHDTIESNASPATLDNSSLSMPSGIDLYQAAIFDGEMTEQNVLGLWRSGPVDLAGALYAYQSQGKRMARSFHHQVFKTLYGIYGRVIDLGLWGDFKGTAVTLDSMGSPTESFDNEPTVLYDPGALRTYIELQGQQGPGYSRSGYMGYIDHARGDYLRVFTKAQSFHPLAAESHQRHPMALTQDGHLAVFQENNHNSPTYVTRYPVDDFPIYADINGSFGSNNSYLFPGYVSGGTLLLICRNGDTYQNNLVWRSGDDGQTWAGGDVISNTGSSDLWNYVNPVYHEGTVYLFTRIRDRSGGGNFVNPAINLFTSPDGINFTTWNGNLSKDVTSSSFNLSDITTHAQFYESPDPSTSLVSVWFIYWRGGKAIFGVNDGSRTDMDIYTLDGTTLTSETIPRKCFMVPKGGDNFECYIREQLTDGANNQLVRYDSTDRGVTLTNPTPLNPPGTDVIRNSFARQNMDVGQPVVIPCNILIDVDKEWGGLFLHKTIAG